MATTLHYNCGQITSGSDIKTFVPKRLNAAEHSVGEVETKY